MPSPSESTVKPPRVIDCPFRIIGDGLKVFGVPVSKLGVNRRLTGARVHRVSHRIDFIDDGLPVGCHGEGFPRIHLLVFRVLGIVSM